MVDKGKAALLALVMQNTLLVLTMRYSRTRPGPMYLASTAVVVDEALKACVCVAALLWQWREQQQQRAGGGARQSAAAFFQHEVCERPAETLKMGGVALLYTLQKNALYVAVSNLDAAVFQLTYQFKNLTTAIFSCALLGRTFSQQQIFALVVLTGGVGLVQLDTATGGSGEKTGEHHTQNHLVGVAAVLVACCTSGFAGVYFERILKGSKQGSLFAKNLQLSAFAFVFAVMFGVSADLDQIQSDGFFQGYSPLVCAVVVLEACGGLVVAVVIKYADNILKTLATSLSIVTSTTLSFWLLNLQVSYLFVVGGALVLVAIYLYSVPRPSAADGKEGSDGDVASAVGKIQARLTVRRRLRALCMLLLTASMAGAAYPLLMAVHIDS